MRHKTQLNIDIDIDIARIKEFCSLTQPAQQKNTSMPAKHAILAVALCATGAALVAPRLHVQTTKLAARGRLLDELADLDGEAPVAVEEAAPAAAPVTEKAVLEPETLFFEGPPSKTELIVPGLSVLTVIGIVPFAAAAARQAWVKYKITSRRISVQSGVGGQDFTEIVYSDIAGMKFVYRGSKDVGDLVISLRDGAKLEMRFVPQFQEIYRYIYERCSPAAQAESSPMADDE